MTIGDVLAVIAAVLTVGAALTATSVLLALALPERTRRVQQALTDSPKRCLARGLGVLLAVALLAGALGHHHAGPMRLLALLLWTGLGALAALGSAGIARLLGERILQAGMDLPLFAALARGAGLVVLASVLPVVGWFFSAPVTLLLALGGGTAAFGQPQTAAPSGTALAVRAEQSEATA